jgi:cell division protein FtsA
VSHWSNLAGGYNRFGSYCRDAARIAHDSDGVGRYYRRHRGRIGIRRFQAERLKCVNGSAIASPADHREMIPVHGPGEEFTGQLARHADEKNRIPRAELISIITAQLSTLMDEISKVLKQMGFAGVKGAQVVFTGGGAELAGLADFAQGALGRPVRIGRPANGLLKGLPEAHATPGFRLWRGLRSMPHPIRRTFAPSVRPVRGAGRRDGHVDTVFPRDARLFLIG